MQASKAHEVAMPEEEGAGNYQTDHKQNGNGNSNADECPVGGIVLFTNQAIAHKLPSIS